MGNKLDLNGMRFGKLTVVQETGRRDKSGSVIWKCDCDCGKIAYVKGASLKGGITKSCGCLSADSRLKNCEYIWQEMIGKKYGKLTVIKEIQSVSRSKHLFLCKCDCENEHIVDGNSLKRGHTKSCGCLAHVRPVTTTIETGYTKGYPDLYKKISNMRDRCYNPNNKCYDIYGARGIKVCDEWVNSYESFKEWALSNGYSKGLTIDRIDCNGDYCPENCRFADAKEQANNRRTNVVLSINGKEYSTLEAEKEFGISRQMLARWKRQGKDLDKQIELFKQGKIRSQHDIINSPT